MIFSLVTGSFEQKILNELEKQFFIDNHYKTICGPVRSETLFLQGGVGKG